MPERFGVVEDKIGVTGCSRGCQLRAVGALPYREVVEVGTDMRRFLMVAACVSALSLRGVAQDAATTAASANKGTTLIGCLAGPDVDDHYTLTSMQHRMGVEVVGDELKSVAGAKVKLTGAWEALPGAEGKKGNAAKRFKATAVSVVEERCAVPSATTPVSKKKAQQQVQQKP
jgi:hypothetical protein